MYGEIWARGLTLFYLITHQAHHRGQMTVLMRQAGLPVPGIYGPCSVFSVAILCCGKIDIAESNR